MPSNAVEDTYPPAPPESSDVGGGDPDAAERDRARAPALAAYAESLTLRPYHFPTMRNLLAHLEVG